MWSELTGIIIVVVVVVELGSCLYVITLFSVDVPRLLLFPA